MPYRPPYSRRSYVAAQATSPCPRYAVIVALTAATLLPTLATSAEVTLEWDPVPDERVAYYELHYGKASAAYENAQQSTATTATISGLDEGVHYYFAVKACNQTGTLCSAFSEELSTTTAYAPPSAGFIADIQTGVAPLTVTFSDTSTGAIDAYAWDFGDGNTSTHASPVHTYIAPGTYSVTLAATGPGGTSSTTKRDAVLVSHAPPVADFTQTTTNGPAPLSVTFADTSTGAVDDYRWDFGDGGTSSARTAVHTFNEPGTYTVALAVTGPGGTATKIKSDLMSVLPAPPAAAFTAASTTGPAPLTVQFSDASTGAMTQWLWDFGDGATSSEPSPAHTYHEPGTFDVALTVTGAGGNDTSTQPGLVEVLPADLKIETGELLLNHNLKRVDFDQAFSDPIVILGPVGGFGSHPVTVRLISSDTHGFWVRLQEWEYLDGRHVDESVAYLVLERGIHQLPGGSWVEAGQTTVDGHGSTELTLFDAPFSSSPVVLASVATLNNPHAVTTRLRDIDLAGFEARLQPEEAGPPAPATETVNYLAWEPSCGEINGLLFKVGATGDDRTHLRSTLSFSDACLDDPSRFAEPPALLANMQTTDGGDTANLRWLHKSPASVTVWVDEEQSRDSETNHTTEILGYLAIHPQDAVTPPRLYTLP